VKKTKKKITWLAAPSPEHTLPTVSLVDFDYLITKKKLEENDAFADFVTPVTEFKETVLADPNVLDLAKGTIMQFERKGYYIYDGEKDGVREFFKIPDGKAASIASKHVAAASQTPAPVAAAAPAAPAAAPPASSMYHVAPINPAVEPTVETKMYTVNRI